MLQQVVRHAAFAAVVSIASIASAQMGGQMGNMSGGEVKKLPSPPATANVTFAGKTVTIEYNKPSMRGRQIMGGLVPYGQVWRTGANPATSLMTPVPLHVGNLLVPAGNYTVYSVPSQDPDKWMLIINKQTGQWGTEYNQAQDLGRVGDEGAHAGQRAGSDEPQL